MVVFSVGSEQWRCVGWCHLQPRDWGTKRCLRKGEFLRDMIEWEWSESHPSHRWHKSPHTTAHGLGVRRRPQRVSLAGISTFVPSATASLWAINFIGWSYPRMPLQPLLANAGFMIAHPNVHSWRIHPLTLADNGFWAGCRICQMLLHLIIRLVPFHQPNGFGVLPAGQEHKKAESPSSGHLVYGWPFFSLNHLVLKQPFCILVLNH